MVGGGISGLGAAWMLRERHEVHLFEAADRLGGHTHTVIVDRDGDGRPTGARSDSGLADRGPARNPLALDTGFLIFNRETYPHLTSLFDRLGIRSRDTDMSFSVTCGACGLEYGGTGVGGLFAQPSNALRPSFLRMLADIRRFGVEEERAAGGRVTPAGRGGATASLRGRGATDGGAPSEVNREGTAIRGTLGEFLEEAPYGRAFGAHYLKPMAAALWSSGTRDVERFPMDTLVAFFRNHGLLRLRDRLRWRTVRRGSVAYVREIARALGPDRVRTGTAVRRVERGAEGVRLRFDDGDEAFDEVVLAVHADDALRMLDEPTAAERDLLGPWEYSSNDTWLHTDPSFLPSRVPARASWNYALEDCTEDAARVTASYSLNRLQGLVEPLDYVVTLNPSRPIADDRVLARMTYRHPIYTPDAVATHGELDGLNEGRGGPNTFFCGAYFGYGFHEDGLRSAVQVAERLGGTAP